MKFLLTTTMLLTIVNLSFSQAVFKDDFGTSTSRQRNIYTPSGRTGLYTWGDPNGNNNQKAIENEHYAVIAPSHIRDASYTPIWWFWTGPEPIGNTWGGAAHMAINDHTAPLATDGAVLVVNAGNLYSPIYQRNVVVEPGSTYQISYWVYIVNASASIATQVLDGTTNPDGSNPTLQTVSASGAIKLNQINNFSSGSNGTWQQVSHTFSTTDDCSPGSNLVTIFLKNALANTSGTDYYIDDIELIKMSGTSTNNVCISNKAINITGNVFNNRNNNNNNATGAASAAGATFISIVNNGTILFTVPVNTDGTYTINNMVQGRAYELVLHNNPDGQATAALASGWDYTSEGVGTVDPVVDPGNGIITIAAASTNTADLSNVNFAIYDGKTPLPVDFASITATLSGNHLFVHWSTLKETNNSHFEVEASKDGKNFTSIGKVASKASDGNTDTGFNYDFTTGAGNATGLLGLSVVSIALAALLTNRRNKTLFMLAVVSGSCLFAVACAKKDINSVETDARLYIRIKQVDKDGAFKYSKIITAISK